MAFVKFTGKYKRYKNMEQTTLFGGFNTEKLKLGKEKCPCCGKLMRAYHKTLDKRLIDLAFDCYDWMKTTGHKTFNPRSVFNEEHQKINDFQKLGYFGIIKRTYHAGWWKLTLKGYQFLTGKIQLPKDLWIFNREVIDEGEDYVNIATVNPRWQTERSDYTMDYIIKDLEE